MTTEPRPTRERVIDDGARRLARWSGQLLLIAAALVLLGLIVGWLWPVAFPVFLGLLIASVFEPLVTRLRAWGWPSLLATAVVFLLALGILVGVVVAIIPTVADQAPQLAQGAIGGIDQVQAFLAGPPFNLGQTQIGQAVQVATERLQQNAASIAGGVVTGISTVATGLVNIVLAVVVAFLFVKDGPRFLPWLRRLSGPTAGAHLSTVGVRVWGRLGGFIRSQALIGLVDSVFIGIGLVLLGIPLALPLAVLTFFGAFVPIVGALVAGALSVLVALVSAGPLQALFVLILILAVQQIEGNLLQPLVQGKGLGLHAAVVILAVTGGSSLFGIAGAFFAVPVAAVVAEVLRYIGERIDERSGVDPEPDDGVVSENDVGTLAETGDDEATDAGETQDTSPPETERG
ncbi:AI-2E family transporter [Pseudonocardia endophytica]|uniref:Putative PurR-regulated permease PerM n=1 Tax=Pseudonocardia endophytica TaxID=401976 RepID=A0A4R1HH29_PSEEN|nr:AI-2E family transporter [Pseudonocardia endophytica]TCK21497.1 putative PurR-regulated permease PerM [Pseudonocardia endophytica]